VRLQGHVRPCCDSSTDFWALVAAISTEAQHQAPCLASVPCRGLGSLLSKERVSCSAHANVVLTGGQGVLSAGNKPGASNAKEAAVQSKGWQALAGRVRRGGSTGLTTELGSGGAGPVGESSRSRCTPHTAPAPPALYANLAYCYILFGCHLVRPARMPERGC
jgi:hypothetical protein